LPKPFFDCIRQNNQDEEAFIVALSARLQAERDAASEQMSLSDQIKKKLKNSCAARKVKLYLYVSSLMSRCQTGHLGGFLPPDAVHIDSAFDAEYLI